MAPFDHLDHGSPIAGTQMVEARDADSAHAPVPRMRRIGDTDPMSSVETTTRPREVDAWTHHGWIWPALTIFLLAVTTAGTVGSGERSAGAVVGLLVLVLAFGGWQLVWRPWRGTLRDDTARALLWGLGTIGVWAALTSIDGVFHLLLFVMFALLFVATDWRIATGLAMVLAVVIGAVNLPPRPGASDGLLVMGLVVVSAALAVLFGAWIQRIIEQSDQRARLIAELDATRAELAVAERAAGAQSERVHIATEIHDTLAQGLTSIVVLLDEVRPHVDGSERQGVDSSIGDSTGPQRLDLAIAMARSSLAEARHLVADLKPVDLVDATLAAALRRVGERFAAVSRVAVEFQVDGCVRRLATSREVALLRVAQEALSNIGRHADATAVSVVLRYGPDDGVELDIRDDGCGFDAGEARAGFGLSGMRRRVERLGGDIRIEAAPGRGTRIAVCL